MDVGSPTSNMLPFPPFLILRKSAMIISESQMQTKLSTTLKADAIEVEHTTAVIFPSALALMAGPAFGDLGSAINGEPLQLAY